MSHDLIRWQSLLTMHRRHHKICTLALAVINFSSPTGTLHILDLTLSLWARAWKNCCRCFPCMPLQANQLTILYLLLYYAVIYFLERYIHRQTDLALYWLWLWIRWFYEKYFDKSERRHPNMITSAWVDIMWSFGKELCSGKLHPLEGNKEVISSKLLYIMFRVGCSMITLEPYILVVWYLVCFVKWSLVSAPVLIYPTDFKFWIEQIN